MTTPPRSTRATSNTGHAGNGLADNGLAEGELRRVSILFADITDSTAMVQHLGPEATAELLDPPLDAMRAAVDRYDGVVSHLGDGILAVFGAPSACEDHAVRACLAALSIQGAVAELPRVRVRIGIHTGDVIMRERRVGRSQIWQPVGPALSLAARIEQSAEPGTIAISAATAEHARGFVEISPLPALQAKGFDDPLELSRLTAAEPGANRWTVRSANGLLDMVDRTEELALLRQALAATGTATTIHVQGDPGIGKSRLLHEALRTADPATTHIVRLSGDPHRQDAAFHAFAVWLRGWLDIRAGDPAEAARQRLADRTRRVAGLTGRGRDSLWRMLGLGTPAPSGMPEADIAPDATHAVTALLRQGAGNRRLVLACEDLDCFDPASRDLLSALLDDVPTDGLLLLTTSRTRVRLHGPGVPHTIHLQPLVASDTLRLLTGIDRRFAGRPDLTQALHEKTGGNPLFLEEIGARAAQSFDRLTAGRDLATEPEQVPDRVEALIADRLNRLPRALRRLVQFCAVVGDTISVRLLSRLADIPEGELHRLLLRLQTEQILTETRRYPDPEFAFRHGLTRETAYHIILAARRRGLHRAAVEVLEREGASVSSSPLDDLCFHAVHAQDWPRAVLHLHAAATLATGKSAYQVARLRLDQALAASRRLPDDDARARTQLAMLLDMRVLLGAAGRYAEVAASLDEAAALAQRLGDRAAEVRIMVQRVHILNIAGRMDEAVVLGQEAHHAATAFGDPAQVILSAHHLAQAHYNRGRVQEAIAVLSGITAMLGAVDATPRPGSTGSLPVMVNATLAFALALAGDDAAARTAADAAQAGADATGRPYDGALASLAGGMARTRSHSEDAADLLLNGIAMCETNQIAQAAPPLQAGLGHVLLRSSNWAGAATWLAQAYAASLEQTRSMVMSWAAAGLARALWELDDRDTAARLANEAVEVARMSGYGGYLVIALRLRAAQLGPAEAAASLHEAATLATALGLAGELADCRAALDLLG